MSTSRLAKCPTPKSPDFMHVMTLPGGTLGRGGAKEEEEEEERPSPSATALPRCRRLVPPCYVPEGDSPLSLLATILRE